VGNDRTLVAATRDRFRGAILRKNGAKQWRREIAIRIKLDRRFALRRERQFINVSR
jgi:hypothetical protein